MKSTADAKTGNLALRFFSNAGIYGLGAVIVRFGAFLVLPLYWQVLTPADFGLIAISQIISLPLVSILDLGLSGCIQRHYFEWEKNDRPHQLAGIWTASFVYSFLLCVLLTLAAPLITRFLEGEAMISLVYFGIWTAFFQNMGILPFSLFRVREQMKLYSYLSLSQFAVQIGSILFFLYQLKMGYSGYLWGTLLGSFIYGLLSLAYIFRQVAFPWKWSQLKKSLRYSLPTVPGAILEGAGNVLDRFFLQRYVPLAELGIYSLSRQVSQAYNFFLSNLKNSWIPLAFRIVAERKDAAEVLSRLSTYYLLALLFPATLISAVAGDVIVLINKPEYFGVAAFVPYFVLAIFFIGFGHIHGRGIEIAKRTEFYWLVYGTQFFSNVFFLITLTPVHGAWGAVYSLILSNMLREVVQVGLAYYVYPRKVDVRAVLISVTVHLAAFFLCQRITGLSPWTDLIVKGLIVLGAALLNIYFVLGSEGFARIKEFIMTKLRKKSA